jgi:hypothetical protein
MRQVVALLTRSLGQREAKKARYVHRSPKRAQPVGRINRGVILYRASGAVNWEAAWRATDRLIEVRPGLEVVIRVFRSVYGS